MSYFRLNVGLIFLFLFCFVGTSLSQLRYSGANLMEFQLGKLPNESVEVFPSIYDRAEVALWYKGFSSFITVEQYHTIYDERGYIDLSQANLRYRKKGWDISVGNMYETLGRGLLLRSFEISGAILEDIGFRSRTYFHKDILGASVKYKTKKAFIHIMRADVLNNVLPPTFDRKDRRTDLVTSISAEYKYLKKHKVGINGMLHERPSNDDFLGSVLFEGPISKSFNYYIEVAGNVEESDRNAIYAGVNGYHGSLSFGLEYKRYKDFVLGSGINEPPALIKQHTYRTLNRSTHVTNPLNEEGYQLDVFYSFKDASTINFNHSLAINQIGNREVIFQEYFLEASTSLSDNAEIKLFIDYSEDPFKNENQRISGGAYADISIGQNLQLIPEFEYQQFNRDVDKVQNMVLSLGLMTQSKFFFSILAELTNDPFLVNEDKSTRLYLGNSIRFTPNYKNTFQLFFGERRGGPQCSAGVCYEILDFRGMEIRWTTRFNK